MTAAEEGAVHGGKHNDNTCILDTIERLHLKLKDDYTVRWELDRYLLALHHCYTSENRLIDNPVFPPPLLVLELSDTYHYYNLPDLIHTIRNTLMGVCCAPWLQKLFNMFLCGKRYRRLITTSHTTCQLTAAIINTLHGLLLGLYPFNERRMDIRKRAWLAGTMREALTATGVHSAFINAHPNLICLGLAEYIINVVDDFSPVEWSLLGVTASAKSQCLAVFESFRDTAVSAAVGAPDFWTRLEKESQPIVASVVKYFKDATFYQHRPRTILPAATVQHLPLAMRSRVIQNSCSIFGQLKAALPDIQFRESEALEEIWTSLYVRGLPCHTTARQMECLERKGRMCYLVEEELHHFPVCLACALTKRADVMRGMFRYDYIDARLVCNECTNHAHVVNINLLGRILYIRDKAIVLCEECLRPRYWGSVCACKTEEDGSPRTCCACHNTNIVSTKEVVDVASMEMRQMHFCYKHSLSCVLNPSTVYDLKSLESEMCARHQPGAPCGTRR